MLNNWMLPTFLALVTYGFWGFFPKLAMNHINARSAVVYEMLGVLLVSAIALVMTGFQPQSNPRGILFAVLTGATGMLGTFFYFAAAGRGCISVVVSLTALYPLVTILLAFLFLREPVTIKQLCGMACAIVAILLLSS